MGVRVRYRRRVRYRQAYNKRTRVRYRQRFRQAYNKRTRVRYRQRYRQRYLHKYAHRTVAGWRWIRKGSRVAYVNAHHHYEVTFSIIPRRRVNGWSNVLHVTATNRNCCGWADRIPGIWFFSRTSRMHIRSGHSKSGNHGLDPPNHLPWNRVSHVRVRAHGNRLCVWIWGATRYGRCIATGNRRFTGRAHMYVSDPWYHQAGAQISNVWFRHMTGSWRYRWAHRWAYRWAHRWAYKYVTKYVQKKRVRVRYRKKTRYRQRFRQRFRQ